MSVASPQVPNRFRLQNKPLPKVTPTRAKLNRYKIENKPLQPAILQPAIDDYDEYDDDSDSSDLWCRDENGNLRKDEDNNPMLKPLILERVEIATPRN